MDVTSYWGELATEPTIEWAQQMLRKPVVDHWWQTETGWTICGNFVGVDMVPVTFRRRVAAGAA